MTAEPIAAHIPTHDMGPATAEECELFTDAEASITAARGLPRKAPHLPSGRPFRRPPAVAERSRRRAVEYVEAKRQLVAALREGNWDLDEHPTLEGYLQDRFGHLEDDGWVLLLQVASDVVNPPRIPRKQRATSHVYFIQPTAGGLIKIGAAGDPQARLLQLQTGCPVELALLATMPGTKKTETELHAQFADVRVRGEWFEPTESLLAYIERHAS
jgi:Meiotically Up-regulated Gene 113 (MUG113) protein